MKNTRLWTKMRISLVMETHQQHIRHSAAGKTRLHCPWDSSAFCISMSWPPSAGSDAFGRSGRDTAAGMENVIRCLDLAEGGTGV